MTDHAIATIIFFFSSRRRHTRYGVTGVQTCALPIFLAQALVVGELYDPIQGRLVVAGVVLDAGGRVGRLVERLVEVPAAHRTGERRVGEEGRSRGGPYH